ncbi:MAG: DUF3786 domain-containing protein [Deltaproteobacteria bacterium]|nr:DUF3786 domain-containing protein [Deltaproteobacteria bacterium]
MALSVLDVYKRVLPKTNCGDCGRPSCLAFASMVVSEGEPLKQCPHLDAETLAWAEEEIDAQRAEGKWARRDPAADALVWARERAASIRTADLPGRIGGTLVRDDAGDLLQLPYFNEMLRIRSGRVEKMSGEPLTRWEQVFLCNHMAQGGSREPTGVWKGLVELPNTISKVKSMKRHVEDPLIERFRGRREELVEAGRSLGGEDVAGRGSEADAALEFRPLPRIPVMLLFWDEEPEEGYGARVKLLFDETIVEHLDIESIMFLSERIRQLLCGEGE